MKFLWSLLWRVGVVIIASVGLVLGVAWLYLA